MLVVHGGGPAAVGCVPGGARLASVAVCGGGVPLASVAHGAGVPLAVVHGGGVPLVVVVVVEHVEGLNVNAKPCDVVEYDLHTSHRKGHENSTYSPSQGSQPSSLSITGPSHHSYSF